jgi:hypothetical protein
LHLSSTSVCTYVCMFRVWPQAEWLDAVLPHISERMQLYAASEVRFNLMALVADRRMVLQQQVRIR